MQDKKKKKDLDVEAAGPVTGGEAADDGVKEAVKASEKKADRQDNAPEDKKKRSASAAGRGKEAGKARPSRRPVGQEDEEDPIIEEVIKINRVAKVVKGGKNFSFSAMVVAGDGKGSYGLGFGKSNEVVGSIRKGSTKARRNFKKVNLKGDTIPHEVIGSYKSSRVLLKPAGTGTGVIAGGPVRALCDAVGIKDILTKSLGSRNAINVAKAAADGLDKLRLTRRR